MKKTKKKVLRYNINAGCFHMPMVVIIGDYDAAHIIIEKYLDGSCERPDTDYEKDGTLPGACVFYSPYKIAMWFPRKPKISSKDDVSTVAHEVTHAVFHILDRWASVKHSYESGETYAHLTGHITDQIFNLK